MELFITLLIIVAIVAVIIKNQKKKENELARLKSAYDKALKGTNKRTALIAGRAYYSSLREGKTLTMYDEQAITNDLSAMKDTVIASDRA